MLPVEPEQESNTSAARDNWWRIAQAVDVPDKRPDLVARESASQVITLVRVSVKRACFACSNVLDELRNGLCRVHQALAVLAIEAFMSIEPSQIEIIRTHLNAQAVFGLSAVAIKPLLATNACVFIKRLSEPI